MKLCCSSYITFAFWRQDGNRHRFFIISSQLLLGCTDISPPAIRQQFKITCPRIGIRLGRHATATVASAGALLFLRGGIKKRKKERKKKLEHICVCVSVGRVPYVGEMTGRGRTLRVVGSYSCVPS